MKMTEGVNQVANHAGVEKRYLQCWADSLARVLGRGQPSPVSCTWLEQPPEGAASAGDTDLGQDDLWIAGASSGRQRGELSLRISPESAIRLAQMFARQPFSPENEIRSEQRDAVLEGIRQVAGQVAAGQASSSPAIGNSDGAVQMGLEISGSPPSWPSSSTAWLCVGDEPSSGAVVELHLSAALVASLRAEESQAVPASLLQDSAGLDLLMDVELALTLRFGSRSLPLREVLDLAPGSVIELDRQVESAVDVLLDGRVVARGEVVVIEGNYGLRVTEVGPPDASRS